MAARRGASKRQTSSLALQGGGAHSAFNRSVLDRLLEHGRLNATEYRRVRMQLIQNLQALIPLGASSKVNVESKSLTHLRDIGLSSVEDPPVIEPTLHA